MKTTTLANLNGTKAMHEKMAKAFAQFGKAKDADTAARMAKDIADRIAMGPEAGNYTA